ncbi:MAG TPA: 23S rRNA (uridine(2552)-2'-O)-methyltransferase RlmE [Gammaproteobacteria bacterium]|nr:23S rRNA (uridine(2552)-2'-O)-methyltransferase RlmE [Gammaproteobacteria bacterium]
MRRTNSSARWLDEHFNDPYVKRAQKAGYRSRAAFKLLEIQERDKLLRSGMTIIDLGAAPGGWAAVAKQLVGEGGRVIALDILPMPALAGVEFIQGDFNEEAVEARLLTHIDNCPVDLVMSDMAPNMSGIGDVDQSRSMLLAEQALAFAEKVLKPGGCLLVKVFQGAGFDEFLRDMRVGFSQVKIRKPKASRARSNEIYLLGFGYKRSRNS